MNCLVTVCISFIFGSTKDCFSLATSLGDFRDNQEILVYPLRDKYRGKNSGLSRSFRDRWRVCKLQWPILAGRRLFQKLCVCKRILGSSSILSPDLFLKHPRPTASHKNSHPLYRPYVWTLHHRSSFLHSVIDHWNKVPQSIAGLTSKTLKLN